MIPKNCFSVPLWKCGSPVKWSVCKPLFDLFQNSGMFIFHKSHPMRHPSHVNDHRFISFRRMSPSFELKTHLMSGLPQWFLLLFFLWAASFYWQNGANLNKVQPQKKQVYQQRLQKEERKTNEAIFPFSQKQTERLNWKNNLYQSSLFHYCTF